jgi:hypothetical protein
VAKPKLGQRLKWFLDRKIAGGATASSDSATLANAALVKSHPLDESFGNAQMFGLIDRPAGQASAQTDRDLTKPISSSCNSFSAYPEPPFREKEISNTSFGPSAEPDWLPPPYVTKRITLTPEVLMEDYMMMADTIPQYPSTGSSSGPQPVISSHSVKSKHYPWELESVHENQTMTTFSPSYPLEYPVVSEQTELERLEKLMTETFESEIQFLSKVSLAPPEAHSLLLPLNQSFESEPGTDSSSFDSNKTCHRTRESPVCKPFTPTREKESKTAHLDAYKIPSVTGPCGCVLSRLDLEDEVQFPSALDVINCYISDSVSSF